MFQLFTRSLRILVVQSDEDDADIAPSAFIHGMGHTSVAVASPEEMLECLESIHFDALVVDGALACAPAALEAMGRFLTRSNQLVPCIVIASSTTDSPDWLALGAQALADRPLQAPSLQSTFEALRSPLDSGWNRPAVRDPFGSIR